ncbi:mechanosensitive ion channel family protein [Flavilitoribacter nigricans]|uniref:Mechanosensitive ion channel protein MscS n=1 Tax=Flavilitoribacter nigricans (strain ATCC 23147 / DSM 23189 / NBRC 102662 / NCIMB 1420 / SS-2) TaxID=1122177 RepID=A0A2D0N1U0_FLAN2|nr:mechanosensitive ion channel family protein [Flavilitoribacter nigricans]PHN02348.1 mechanosensitive ion channel protein MscS [Flavilitoribacter nigricans DSM 23189 = NBRC 102662]
METTVQYLENLLQNWEASVLEYLPKVFLALFVLLIFGLLARFIKRVSLKSYARAFKSHLDLANLISGMFYFFFMLSGIFLALQILGLEKVLTKLLAGAGIVGIIAGFAFKDIASNIFAGLLLKFQRPFQPGDWVEIDDKYGVVLEVGWITTTIKTVPGQEVFVPNQVIYSNTFTNFSTFHQRRIILESGVSYGDDLEHVRTVALDEVAKVKELLPGEGIDFFFTEIANSTYNFQLRFWIKFETNNDFRTALSDIIIRIKKRFEQENISIAYPVTTLDFGVKGGVNLFDKSLQVNT